MSIPRFISSILVFGFLLFIGGPLTAQECENCLSEGGFYEDCDNDEGHDGWYDCQLILWIICYGTQPCDWEDADAIALGADGMKMGQMSLAEIQRERAKESLYSPMGLHPVSGPWAPDSAGPSTKWRDCRGAIVGTFRDAGEIEAIRKTTNQIRF